MKKANDLGFSKAIMWHDIGHGIKWRYYRHWGQNVYAGEGKFDRKDEGVEDHSGCLNKACIITTPKDGPGKGKTLLMDMLGEECVHCKKYINGKGVEDKRNDIHAGSIRRILGHLKCEMEYYKYVELNEKAAGYGKAFKKLVKENKELFIMEEL